MHTTATKHMVSMGCKKSSGLRNVCEASSEVGVVVPSLLRANLEKAGFVIKTTQKKFGCEVEISEKLGSMAERNHPVAVEFIKCATRDPNAKQVDPETTLVVAKAYSHSETDAILQAVYAEMKEEVQRDNTSKS